MTRAFGCALLVLAACPSPPAHPKPVDDTPLRLRIAQAEAKRGDGIADLLALADGTKPERVLALRGLGRIGGPKAIAALTSALAQGDAGIVGAAAVGLGLAASLDDDPGNPAVTKALVDALPRAGDHQPDVIEAIGRASDQSGQETLAQLLVVTIAKPGTPAKPLAAGTASGATQVVTQAGIAEAAALALGRHGRRKIALTDIARDALVAATRYSDSRVRYAAAYALAREQLPAPTNAVTEPNTRAIDPAKALAALLDDTDANVRAIAAQALARRKAVVAHRVALEKGLHDADWRVAVEAVRALGGDTSDDRGRQQVALAIVRWYLGIESGQRIDLVRDAQKDPQLHDPAAVMLARGADRVVRAELLGIMRDSVPADWVSGKRAVSDADAHVVIEGLRTLAPHAKSPVVRHMLEWLVASAASSTKVPQLTRGWIECLGRAALTRGDQAPDYTSLARCALPDHLRLPIVADVVAAKAGTVQQRRDALRPLLAHADARVRVAGMTALASMWDDGDAGDHRAIAATIAAALDANDGLVAGTAVEAAGTIYEAGAKETTADWRTALDAAVIARASREKDAELAASLFELIGKRALAAGVTACREGLKGGPVLAKAAAACLKALGQPADPPPIGGAAPPPQVSVALVIGKRVTWKLETSRGPIEIALDPDAAPWAVATIATLTRKGFYDSLEFHRVVPNFVVQGGDPTQSGWGGPGFAIPAEPSSGAGYLEGGVGMADAGRDSAGSQWFIMHAPAPHLDGRYTWVGRVAKGQSTANSLQIGDRVTRATIDIAPRL